MGLWVTDGTAAGTHELSAVSLLASQTLAAGAATTVAAGATDTESYTAGQATFSVNQAGTAQMATPTGVAALNGFGTVKLSDATVTITGNNIAEIYANGSYSSSTFNITGQAYTGTIADYASNGKLSSIDFKGLAYASGDYATFTGNGSGACGTIESHTASATPIASFAMNQNYNVSQLTLSSDGSGGLLMKVSSTMPTDDFNGDGTSDILAGNAGGALIDLSVKNGTVSGASYVTTLSGGWSYLDAGNFYGNPTTDILAKDASGDIVDPAHPERHGFGLAELRHHAFQRLELPRQWRLLRQRHGRSPRQGYGGRHGRAAHQERHAFRRAQLRDHAAQRLELSGDRRLQRRRHRRYPPAGQDRRHHRSDHEERRGFRLAQLRHHAVGRLELSWPRATSTATAPRISSPRTRPAISSICP